MFFGKRTISILISFLIILAFTGILYLTNNSENRLKVDNVSAQTSAEWYMAGANPQRTSWVTSGIIPNPNNLVWWKTFSAFIPHKVQIIGSGDFVYVSAADGLHALRYDTGAEAWLYRTDMPVGHSPTIVNNVAYFGAYDRKIHAVNATTGTKIWTFQGRRGFDNNPLVINGALYTGGRDGYFYKLNATNGSLIWEFRLETPLSYSPAIKNNILYFGGQNSHAYALKDNGTSATMLWDKLMPGHGFGAFWPVIYGNYVIFAGNHNYGVTHSPYDKTISIDLMDPAWPQPAAEGAILGPYVNGNWVRADTAYNLFKSNPHLRTVFILDSQTGNESEVAPFLWNGNEGMETRFPPVIGKDNLVYMDAGMIFEAAIPFARVLGWKPDTPNLLYYPYTGGGEAIDKPGAIASGGDYIYLSDNRGKGHKLININGGGSRNIVTFPDGYSAGLAKFKYGIPKEGSTPGSGSFDTHGLQNPPIPFRGRVYFHHTNSVFSYGL
ncbi:MAG: hypothetical protein UT08_C0010G0066 [Candidatus Woesebacteria bacterium GW2011_GWB1_38_8]|uniref:Pyrrolo-quinoline quinone repeat domain-containing protein n=1 Tax=Candidatus Woesebacteria bacterium GW2011_GWB1_38_8 TaxID=1618570 RepID=A0A0G0NGZ3_9BACT|nr:MAG: hypothetical protein UT08_C0010G0066 [Candidatus Woesebacteria bacterium GW2011_GWB1_38_8]